MLTIVNKAIAEGNPVVLCTIVETEGIVPRHAGTKMVVFEDGRSEGTVGGGNIEKLVRKEAEESLKDGKTRFRSYDSEVGSTDDPGPCDGKVKIFIEPFLRPATLVVFGAGHVGQAVVHLAKWMGYRVVVSDDRAEMCTPEVAPGADRYINCPMDQIPEKMTVDRNTYIVLVTRSVQMDAEGLPALLGTQAGYIGLLGSKKRWAFCRGILLKAGIKKEAYRRVKSPIGLDIHAETPQEIAVSIMAEITAIRHEKEP